MSLVVVWSASRRQLCRHGVLHGTHAAACARERRRVRIERFRLVPWLPRCDLLCALHRLCVYRTIYPIPEDTGAALLLVGGQVSLCVECVVCDVCVVSRLWCAGGECVCTVIVASHRASCCLPYL